jgi:hypothetical protein
MKKLILLFALAWLALPTTIFAQYSNASVSGPWIITYQNALYIIFDGNGNVTEMGFQKDSVYPVGTYSITSQGALTATINLTQGTTYITGNMLSNVSAMFYIDTTGGPAYMYQVANPATLQGTWTGYIYDSTTLTTRNIQFTVNSSGVITSANGISLISGKIFAVADTVAGYITTSDTPCAYKYIQISGIYTADSITGQTQLGINSNSNQNNPCSNYGRVGLTKISTGIPEINTATDFTVYPNPFTNQLRLALTNPGSKTIVDLYDMLGNKVYTATYNNTANIIMNSLPSLNSSVYFLTLTQGSEVITRKVVKQ